MLLLLLCLVLPIDAEQAQETPKQYDWEDWSFYEILGLNETTTTTSSVSSDAIKKAYRTQAKQWHPDKIRNQQQQQGSTTATKEEANQRFARIAEAYQVLSDPEKRRTYDSYLREEQRQKQRHQQRQEQQQRHQQQQQQPQAPYADSASVFVTELWDSLYQGWQDLDPRRVFEEMFGTVWDDNDDDDAADAYDDYDPDPWNSFDTFDYLRKGANHQQQQNSGGDHGELLHAYEQQHLVVDDWGREFVRLTRTEEYWQEPPAPQQRQQPNNGDARVYVRVLAQDFVEQWDRRARSWVLVAYQGRGPVLVQEGVRSPTLQERRQHARKERLQEQEARQRQREQQERQREEEQQRAERERQQQQKQQASEPPTPESYTLRPGQKLTPQDSLQRNGFLASLTPECQLVVVRLVSHNDLDDDDDDDFAYRDLKHGGHQVKTLWSSDGILSSDACEWQLLGDSGELVVTLPPKPSRPHQRLPIRLWSSASAAADNDSYAFFQNIHKHGDGRPPKHPEYVARLDADGALCVYRITNVPKWAAQALTRWHMAEQQVQAEMDAAEHYDEDEGPQRLIRRNALRLLQRATKLALNLQPATHRRRRRQSRKNKNKKTRDNDDDDDDDLSRFQCIFSTSPVGCLRPARFVWQHAQPVARQVRRGWKKLNSLLDRLFPV